MARLHHIARKSIVLGTKNLKSPEIANIRKPADSATRLRVRQRAEAVIIHRLHSAGDCMSPAPLHPSQSRRGAHRTGRSSRSRPRCRNASKVPASGGLSFSADSWNASLECRAYGSGARVCVGHAVNPALESRSDREDETRSHLIGGTPEQAVVRFGLAAHDADTKEMTLVGRG